MVVEWPLVHWSHAGCYGQQHGWFYVNDDDDDDVYLSDTALHCAGRVQAVSHQISPDGAATLPPSHLCLLLVGMGLAAPAAHKFQEVTPDS